LQYRAIVEKSALVPGRNTPSNLTRREKQALDVLYRLEEATAAQVMEELGDFPSYSAARALMTLLVDKGLAKVKQTEGSRQYIYLPATPLSKARKNALRGLVETFFNNSPAKLAANLLDPSSQKLSPDEVNELRALLDAHDTRSKS
jgi:BlaI family transcriptional regulator, penicillinase repressor